MKQEYDNTAVFYIKTLRKQELIKTLEEGASIYFELTGKNISSKTLGRLINNINFEQINMNKFFELCSKNRKTSKEKEEVKDDINKNKSPLIKALFIPEKDYKPIFDIDINIDTAEEIDRKIMNKISDEVFLLKYLGYNPGEYEVRKISTGSWTTPVKSGIENSLVIVLNNKFSVEIVKKKKSGLFYTQEECSKFLENFLKEHRISPYELFDNSSNSIPNSLKDNLLMVCPGLELHLGKLGSVVDYEDYSTKQAMWRIKKTAQELYEYQKQMKASTLLVGVGNDYFNSDTTRDETTAGTPQNNDTRFKETYLWGKIGYMQFIESLKSEFDKIILKGMPGNHDEKTSFSLLTSLFDLYELTEDPKVDVDFTYKDLRFTTCYEYGDNLIVMSHGKTPEGKNLSDEDLSTKIKYHFPDEYSKAKRVYIFAGHLHQDSEHVCKDPKVMVIRTASLTGIESWHYGNNYLGQREGHSVYLIDKKLGYVGKHNITLSDEDKSQKLGSINRNQNTNVYNVMKKTLDLTEKSIKEKSLQEELKRIDAKIRQIRKEYLNKLKELCSILKLDEKELSEEQREEILCLNGYKEQIQSLEKSKEVIYTYKN